MKYVGFFFFLVQCVQKAVEMVFAIRMTENVHVKLVFLEFIVIKVITFKDWKKFFCLYKWITKFMSFYRAQYFGWLLAHFLYLNKLFVSTHPPVPHFFHFMCILGMSHDLGCLSKMNSAISIFRVNSLKFSNNVHYLLTILLISLLLIFETNSACYSEAHP